jgi:hypothetical protein
MFLSTSKKQHYSERIKRFIHTKVELDLNATYQARKFVVHRLSHHRVDVSERAHTLLGANDSASRHRVHERWFLREISLSHARGVLRVAAERPPAEPTLFSELVFLAPYDGYSSAPAANRGGIVRCLCIPPASARK